MTGRAASTQQTANGGLARLRDFVVAVTDCVSGDVKGAAVAERVRPFLKELVRYDDWLPDAFAKAHPEHYQQYLLYCDPLERFSVVSFVWNAGQSTPVHDHTVWGLVGVLRGIETSQSYRIEQGRLMPGETERLQGGDVGAVGPEIGDIHKVTNARTDGGASISIHVYGANIGAVRRHVFDDRGIATKDFVSGYSNIVLPNIWDRSDDVRSRRAPSQGSAAAHGR